VTPPPFQINLSRFFVIDRLTPTTLLIPQKVFNVEPKVDELLAPSMRPLDFPQTDPIARRLASEGYWGY
jgi:hypothetical protein